MVIGNIIDYTKYLMNDDVRQIFLLLIFIW